MASFGSKIEKIRKIQIKPFPTKRTGSVSVVRVGNVVLGIGVSGAIYSTAVNSNCHYVHYELPEHVFKALVMLGVLTSDEIEEHNADVRARVASINAENDLFHITSICKRQGVAVPKSISRALKQRMAKDANR